MPFTQQVIPTGLSSQTLPNWISALERLGDGTPLSAKSVYWTMEYELGKAKTRDILQKAGFDGITHIGGAIAGTVPHRVYIAFDPKNLFSASSVEGFVPHTTPPLAGFAVGPAALATGRRLQSAPGRRGSKE